MSPPSTFLVQAAPNNPVFAAALGLSLSELLDFSAAPGDTGAPSKPRRPPQR